MAKNHDLRESDNAELYLIVQRTYAFNQMYNTDSSLVRLKEKLDELFQYTAAQWEYLEVNFTEDLNERQLLN